MVMPLSYMLYGRPMRTMPGSPVSSSVARARAPAASRAARNSSWARVAASRAARTRRSSAPSCAPTSRRSRTSSSRPSRKRTRGVSSLSRVLLDARRRAHHERQRLAPRAGVRVELRELGLLVDLVGHEDVVDALAQQPVDVAVRDADREARLGHGELDAGLAHRLVALRRQDRAHAELGEERRPDTAAGRTCTCSAGCRRCASQRPCAPAAARYGAMSSSSRSMMRSSITGCLSTLAGLRYRSEHLSPQYVFSPSTVNWRTSHSLEQPLQTKSTTV